MTGECIGRGIFYVLSSRAKTAGLREMRIQRLAPLSPGNAVRPLALSAVFSQMNLAVPDQFLTFGKGIAHEMSPTMLKISG